MAVYYLKFRGIWLVRSASRAERDNRERLDNIGNGQVKPKEGQQWWASVS